MNRRDLLFDRVVRWGLASVGLALGLLFFTCAWWSASQVHDGFTGNFVVYGMICLGSGFVALLLKVD